MIGTKESSYPQLGKDSEEQSDLEIVTTTEYSMALSTERHGGYISQSSVTGKEWPS